MTGKRERVSCGLDLGTVPDLPSAISDATDAGYQFVFVPIVHPRWRRELISGAAAKRNSAFTRSDMILSSQDWSTLVVGRLSVTHMDLDCKNEARRRHCEQMFVEELSYASHLTLPAIVIPLKNSNPVNLARHLRSRLSAGCSYQIWMEVDLTPRSWQQRNYVKGSTLGVSGGSGADEETAALSGGKNGATVPGGEKESVAVSGGSGEKTLGGDDGETPWLWWHRLRRLCGEESRLAVCLRVNCDLPSDRELDRWLGEPVKCVCVPTSVFTTNRSGFPVLPRAHQQLVRRLLRLGCQLVVSGSCRHAHLKHYWQYLNHVYEGAMGGEEGDTGSIGQFAVGYEDYLQMPLQPLMDNLESHTYEVFEKCPVKYTEYQRAMRLAFLDRVDEEHKNDDVIVVMVVGAGRGPLVRAAFIAATQADRRIKVYAIEKNPNAVVTLQAAVEEEWGDSVTVVSSDMRSWQAPEKADILVSELLGSFGDNELSPECLDGAQRYLKDDGISIPQSYTSYIQPLQSSKLYNDVKGSRERDKPHYTPFEMPYVVYFHNVFRLDRPQSLFTFHHPNYDEIIDNNRFGSRTFRANIDCCMHGIGGYFDAVLYKDVTISTHPENHSKTMCSWFPIFFPLLEPVPIRAGEKIEVSFWRLANARNVWYEWTATSPHLLPIHNPNGRSYTIGL